MLIEIGCWSTAEMIKWWSCVLFLAAVLGAAVSKDVDDTGSQLWWKTAALYQIYPRSFKDSNGDGIGDLKGITQMAEYFKNLGIDAVWLSPIFKSPMVDFGYDISNFKDIDPIFGTMADFEELMAKFHELGIKVMLDFVPNHTSDQHVWFQKSLQNLTDYRDFYVWVDPTIMKNGTTVVPSNWMSIFGGSAWEWSEQRRQYYLHQFSAQQPELNFRNPAVIGNITDVLNFWMDKDVDGFRFDAVPYLFEDKYLRNEPPLPNTPGDNWFDMDHIYTRDQNETFTVLNFWGDVVYKRVQQDGKPRVMLLEAYAPTPTAVKYYGEGKGGLEFPFNFNLMGINQADSAAMIKTRIYDWLTYAPKDTQLTWVLGNHDNPRCAERYGTEMVDAINILSGVLPGIKVTFYGEEIGMMDTFVRWDETVDPMARNKGPDHYLEITRDPERTPMQWDDSISGGFSTNCTTWLPVNPNFRWLNVKAQMNSDNSHWKVFQKMLQARKDPVLQFGDLNVIPADKDTLLVIRSYQGASFVLLINLGNVFRTYTSHDFFANYSLDASMYVVVSSVQSGFKTGHFMQQGSLNVTVWPKTAILFTTKTWNPTPSGAPPMLCGSLLAAFAVLLLFKA